MANSYKPKQVVISSIAPNANPIVNEHLTTTLWSHILIYGTAKLSGAGAAIPNAAVLLWYTADSTKVSVGNANNATFTDVAGKYAVTVPVKTDLIVKVYN